MRKPLRYLLSAATVALLAGATLAATAGTAEARRGGFFLGIALPPLFIGPPAYYYPPPPPPVYYPPPGYYAPPPAPPPCRARYDWRWDGYAWRQVYVGCW